MEKKWKKTPQEIYPMTLSDNPFDHQETKMTQSNKVRCPTQQTKKIGLFLEKTSCMGVIK